MKEERQSWERNLLHDFHDVRLECTFELLCINDNEFNCHVLVLKDRGFDPDNFAFQGNHFPSLLLLHFSDLFLIIKQLNVSFGTGKLQQWWHDTGKIRHKILAQDPTHSTPTVKEVLRLGIISICNVS